MTSANEQQPAPNDGIRHGRHRVDFDDNTVVFLIGMRINSLWRVRDWFPVFSAMPKMLRELRRNRQMGLLGFDTWFKWREFLVVQYWKDLDHLMAYATKPDSEHLPAWRSFNRRARNAHSVGIWHEAYEVHPETSHIIYRDMPPTGMGTAGNLVDIATLPPQPVKRRGTAPDNDADVATG